MNILIEGNHVHIWQTNLKALSVYPFDISKTLSSDELERSSKFKSQKDQEDFIFRHYTLRSILSKYCNCQPGEIKFRYNTYKKPSVSVPQSSKIKFNMSYSGEIIIVGVCLQNDIGVDIEKVRKINNIKNIAAENFSLQELKLLNSKFDKTNTFFKIWTRKEAFIKAYGNGIYYPLKSFCVDINSSGGYEHLAFSENSSESGLWRTSELDIVEGYIASMAIKSDNFKISYFKTE